MNFNFLMFASKHLDYYLNYLKLKVRNYSFKIDFHSFKFVIIPYIILDKSDYFFYYFDYNFHLLVFVYSNSYFNTYSNLYSKTY